MTKIKPAKRFEKLSFRAFADRYLYVSRTVDGAILNLLDETQETARFYQQQESERGRRLFDFALPGLPRLHLAGPPKRP